LAFEDLGLLFFTALVLSLLLTPASIKFAYMIGAIDLPVDRSVHTRAMPRMGGLGMALSAVIALLLFVELNQILVAFLLGVGVIVATGVVDDLYQISPAQKIAGQIVACLLFLLLSGLRLESFGDLLGLGAIYFSGWNSLLITLFCMLGIINAFNLSDGLDGLAAGLTAIAAIFMSVLALHAGNMLSVAIILAVLGGVFGFLKFNTHPAKLFMGDTGSLTLGFFMAGLMVYLIDFKSDFMPAPMTLAIILMVPISDTLWVMVKRIMNGKSPVSPDKTHLHHRLLHLGFSHAAVVTLIYVLGFAFGFLALLLHGQADWVNFSLALMACAVLYGGLSLCESCGYNIAQHISCTQQRELKGLLVRIIGKSLNWFRFVILFGLVLPFFFVDTIPSNAYHIVWATFLLLLLVFPWKEHQERLNIVYALLYLAGFVILYVWNISSYQHFNLPWYALGFVFVLSIWSALKIVFKGHHEMILTSGLELLLIVMSWFIPYILLPALAVSEALTLAAKTSCLEAIPLLIAVKIVVRRQPDRNRIMALGMMAVLLLMFLTLNL